MRLTDTLTLATASRYLHPANAADKLPVVFGDFRDPFEPSGYLKAVLINTIDWVYLLSDSFIDPTGLEVYSRQNTQYGALVPPNLYDLFVGWDIEGQGPITAIRFNTLGPNPTNFEITWRGRGTVGAGNVLVRDPIAAVHAMFTVRGNWLTSDFDPVMMAQSKGLSDRYGIFLDWVFQEDKTYAQWLTEIFETFLANVSLNGEGQLLVEYNLWPAIPVSSSQVAAFIDAGRDGAGDDPEASITYDLDVENVCNEVTIEGRWNWAQNHAMGSVTYAHTPSQQRYGRRARSFTLPGIRSFELAQAWISLFLSPLVKQPAQVLMDLKDLRYSHVRPGQFVALTWPAGPEPLGRGWTDRLLLVQETRTDELQQTHGLTTFDTGLSVIPPQAAPFRDSSNALWYLALTSPPAEPYDPATLQLDFISPLPSGWLSVGPERHWVTRAELITGATLYIYPSTAGTVAISLTNPGGTGDAFQTNLVDLYFRHWDVSVRWTGAIYEAYPIERGAYGHVTPIPVVLP